MKFRILIAVLLALGTGLPAAAAVRDVTDPDLPRSLPVDGQVDVRWQDPAQFSDIRYSANRMAARRGDWVLRLAEYLRERAHKRLPAGERLEVEILDIKRAGQYEPWLGLALQDVRMIRDHYPPRIELQFQHTAADGRVIAEGQRKLSDPGFMMGSSINSSDPLRFEKSIIDRWLVREIPASNS